MSVSPVSRQSSPESTALALTTLAKASTESQELGSVSSASNSGDSVASNLSSAFQSLLTSLSPTGSETTASNTASSNAIQSFINGALQQLQSTGASTVGNLVDKTA